jgi:hypothetical protein
MHRKVGGASNIPDHSLEESDMATAEYHRNWYHAHREVELARRKKRLYKHRRFVRHIISEIKLILGCGHCGYDKNSHALDFHHREPDKKSFDVSSYMSRHLLKVLEEIDKCDVLCANCHRIETHNEIISFEK